MKASAVFGKQAISLGIVVICERNHKVKLQAFQ